MCLIIRGRLSQANADVSLLRFFFGVKTDDATSWSVDKSLVHLRSLAHVKSKSSNAVGGDLSQQMLLQMVYTRDVNQLSSGAEPALTLLQRESAAPGQSKAFVYEATRGESCTVANIFFSSSFFFCIRGRESKWELTAGFHHQRRQSLRVSAISGGDLRGKQKQGNKRLEGFSSVQLGVLQLILQAQKHTEVCRPRLPRQHTITLTHAHTHTRTRRSAL